MDIYGEEENEEFWIFIQMKENIRSKTKGRLATKKLLHRRSE